MYNQPYFIPNFYSNVVPPFVRSATINTALRGLGANRGLNLFGRLGNSIKSINWSGIINNTSKTLGLINQAIPVVKRVGPVMNNMKSMLKIASVFKDETDYTPKRKNGIVNRFNSLSRSTDTNFSQNSVNVDHSSRQENMDTSYLTDDYSPTFFVAS